MLATPTPSFADNEAAVFRAFADAVPTLAWMANADGYITWYNRRWHDYCGTTAAAMEGWGWQSVHDPAELPAVLARWTASIESGTAFEMVFPLRGADGSYRPFLTRVEPIRDGLGRVVRWFGTNTDVSTQREAEVALEAARRQAERGARHVQAILSQLGEGVIVTDRDGRINYVNEAAVALHGVARLDVAPSDYAATYHLFTEDGLPYPPQDLPLVRAVRGETVVDARWRIHRPDGSRVVAIGTAQPMRDASGVQVGAVLTIHDDTARYAADLSLRELNRSLEQRVAAALAERKVLADVVASTDAFIMAVGLDYRIMAVNQANVAEFERVYGVRPAVGDHLLDIVGHYPDERVRLERHWSRALAGEEFSLIEEFGSEDHARASYEVKFNALRDRDGNRVGAFNFVTDVTERLRDQARLAEAEERLRQTQKIEAIGQLTGGVAHDFNNLLMVVSGGIDILARQPDDAKRERILAAMRQAVERGATLSRQLLAFARRQPLQPVVVDLGVQIGAMRELLDGSLRGDVSVLTEFADGLWPVAVDPGELELVVLNLAVNARDAMPQGGTIVIRAENLSDVGDPEIKGDLVRLTVTDGGVGMPPDVVARVFEPFFTTKDVGKGSGLGLAQTHGFARASGGVVRVDSVVGVGTTVSLLLPRSLEPALAHVGNAVAPLAQVATVTPLGTVLVVEDDDEVAAFATDMIREIGYAALRVEDAEAALGALAQDRAIDVVFSDVVMPGKRSGIELAHEIRQRWPDLPVLLTSGYTGAAHLPVDPLPARILPKPYRIETLAEAIARAVEEQRQR